MKKDFFERRCDDTLIKTLLINKIVENMDKLNDEGTCSVELLPNVILHIEEHWTCKSTKFVGYQWMIQRVRRNENIKEMDFNTKDSEYWGYVTQNEAWEAAHCYYLGEHF